MSIKFFTKFAVLIALLFIALPAYSITGNDNGTSKNQEAGKIANPGSDCGNGKDVGNHYGSNKNCNKTKEIIAHDKGGCNVSNVYELARIWVGKQKSAFRRTVEPTLNSSYGKELFNFFTTEIVKAKSNCFVCDIPEMSDIEAIKAEAIAAYKSANPMPDVAVLQAQAVEAYKLANPLPDINAIKAQAASEAVAAYKAANPMPDIAQLQAEAISKWIEANPCPIETITAQLNSQCQAKVDGITSQLTAQCQSSIDNLTAQNNALSKQLTAALANQKTPSIINLKIVGSAEVEENKTSLYSCIATYDDGSVQDISTDAEWSVSGGASLIKNQLTAYEVSQDLVITLFAKYSGITGELSITIKDKAFTQRFIDNGDGTVTDNKTGMMWQLNPPNTRFTWQEALNYAENLELAGYNDWRMPNIVELESLVDTTKNSPATSSGIALQSFYYYWTSTTSAYASSSAWYIDFTSGRTDFGQSKISKIFVVAVRLGNRETTGVSQCYSDYSNGPGLFPITCPNVEEPFYGQDAQHHDENSGYTVVGDGTVIDKSTNLMWEGNISRQYLTWEKATTYCDCLTTGGHTDWRMPSRLELVTIVNFGKNLPAIDTNIFGSSSYPVAAGHFWTTDPVGTGETQMWKLGFERGSFSPTDKTYPYYQVRCVRNIDK
ncbi:MAG: DUF1566 domain-containing protein [Desulfobacterales bacterium]|nr:DUF1566 domain-containing protein [Desulfobacterales bacterium]